MVRQSNFKEAPEGMQWLIVSPKGYWAKAKTVRLAARKMNDWGGCGTAGATLFLAPESVRVNAMGYMSWEGGAAPTSICQL